MEEIFLKEGSNIALTKNERTYFFRIFDAKCDKEKIHETIKDSIMNYVYNGRNIGKGLQIKNQDELIGEEGTHRKRIIGVNRFKVPMKTTSKEQFDAQSDPLSTILRTKEEHKELDKLNDTFSKRLDEENRKSSLPEEKGKTIKDKDKISKNKKRVVITQG
ncbi:hypothetical protein RhiirB3_435977 [Rhizophagus irregularis]|nr:hypothetical protein RhiirB3_435977 [Rhizophagus irregularis]